MALAEKALGRFDTAATEDLPAAERSDSGGSLLNVLTGMGTRSDRSSHYRVRPVTPLDQDTCENLYGNWIPAKVVNLVASRATRAGWSISLDGKADQSKVADIDRWVRQHGLFRAIKECAILERLYGGAVAVIMADDGQEADQPLDLKRVRSFDGLKPLDRYQLFPALEGRSLFDYREAEKFNVLTYQSQVNPKGDGAKGANFFTIHRSRLLLFWGAYAPYRVRQENQGWGYSALQSVYDPWRRFEAGLNGLGVSLQDFNLFIRKLNGVANKVARGRKQELLERLRLDALVQSVMGGLLLDEGEDASFVSRSYAGVSDVISQFSSAICGATQIPHTLLFGESPSGLGATGRSEERDFASLCEEYQDDHLAEPLRYLMAVVMSAKNGPTNGKELAGWDIKFPPTFVLNETEKADLIAKYAQADQLYIGNGTRTPEETAIDRFSSTEFGTDWTLGYKRKVVDPAEVQATEEAAAPAETATEETPAAQPEETLPAAVEADLLDSLRGDTSDPVKRIYRTNGLSIGVTHDPMDVRNGYFQKHSYGHVRGTYGLGRDKRAVDCYINADPTQDAPVFRVRQLDNEGIYDEDKLMLGFTTIQEARDAFAQQMPSWAYGGIERLSDADLDIYRAAEATYAD